MDTTGFSYNWSFENPWAHRHFNTLPRKGRYRKKKTIHRSSIKDKKPRKNRPFSNVDTTSLICNCNNGCLFQVSRRGITRIRQDFDSKLYNEQNLILLNMMSINMKERRNAIDYFLIDGSLQKKKVCRLAFLKVFGISKQRIRTTVGRRIPFSPCLSRDIRGSHGNHRKRLTREAKLTIENHMKTYVFENPHYTRIRNTGTKYLSAVHNMKSCFRDYVKSTDIAEGIKVRFTTFRKYVLENIDIIFKRPRRDSCRKCDNLMSKMKFAKTNLIKQRLEQELLMHLTNADKQYASINYDFTVLSLKPSDEHEWEIPPLW